MSTPRRRVSDQPRSRRLWMLLMAVLVGLSIVVIVASAVVALNAAEASRNELCKGDRALAEMQREFLAEHAELRADLRGAEIHTHVDPDRLERLERLIRAADCIPDED